MMRQFLLLLASVAVAAASAGETLRQVEVAVFTKGPARVHDLSAEELVLEEEGHTRPVLWIKRDTRPQDVALVIDSSADSGGQYQGTLVPAAVKFLRALPPDASAAVWTSGGAPSKVVDFGTDPETAERALQMVAAGGRYFALETMIDASRDLARRERARRTLVVVTHTYLEGTQTLIEEAFSTVGQACVTPMLLLGPASSPGDIGNMALHRYDAETFGEQLALRYGGWCQRVLTSQAVERPLQRVAADLSFRYLVGFSSGSDQVSVPKVKVRRKGVEARAGIAVVR
jgi:hypothetical protein